MNTRRKSTLFLTEQLIVIAVFALCAIACISILTASFFMARESRDKAGALIAAQNYAEAMKAFDGDIKAVADMLSNRYSLTFEDGDTGFLFLISMDDRWVEISPAAEHAYYTLTMTGSTVEYSGLMLCEVSVFNNTGKTLATLPVAVRTHSGEQRG